MAADAPSAFFSYSREDQEFALRLAKDLKKAGANVWMDRLDIRPGELWEQKVEEALKNCPRLLVILSPASVNSRNVMAEVAFALEEQKEVVPVLCRDCSVPFRLRPFQYVDFRNNYAKGLERLLATVPVRQPSALFKPDVTVLEAERILTFHDAQADRATVERSALVRANRRGIVEFWFRNITCDGDIENKLMDGAPLLPEDEKIETGVLRVRKRFSPAMDACEQRKVRLSYDVLKAFKPTDELKFYSPIDDETNELRVIINFHSDRPCVDADLSIAGPHDAPLPGLLRAMKRGLRTEAEIKNPLPGYEYVVRWNW